MTVFNISKGTWLAQEVETAFHFWQRLQGLIGRKEFKKGKAMWIKPCRSVHTFFMNFPIDLLFLDRKNRVIMAYEALSPWRITPIISKSYSVLELPLLTIRETKTSPLDQLQFVE